MRFDNSRRRNAATTGQMADIETLECRDARVERFRQRSLSRPLDPWHDAREPVLSLRLPIVPLSSGSTLPVFNGRDQRSRVQVCVDAVDPAAPVATRSQTDTIVWATSELTRRKNLDMELPAYLDARLGDILQFIRRQEGGTQYRWLRTALQACSNTTVEIAQPGTDAPPKRFQLLRSIEPLGPGEVRVHLDPWLADEVIRQRIVHISPDAFALPPLQRRLYSYAKAMLGRLNGSERRMSYWEAYDRSGSSDEPRKFRAALSKLERSQRLPDFTMCCIGRGPRMEIGFTNGASWFGNGRSESSPGAGVIVLDIGLEIDPEPPKESPILEVDLSGETSLWPSHAPQGHGA
ncbi:replication initiator protein A [Sandarakinorhabdus sp.]|uniref:replication initiator protein A n=1 Tax=Sandarakinorhabdus sp. TaxID=1916663 RepID=UPI003F6F4FAB